MATDHPTTYRAYLRTLVRKDVGALDIDLSACIAEEGTDTPRHDLERALTSRPVRLPVVPRNDQEQMMRIRRPMCLPQVFEVVVVRRSSTALDLSDHPAPRSQTEEEVRSSLRDEAALGRQDHLFAELQFKT